MPAIGKYIMELVAMVTEKDPSEIPLDAHLIKDVGADSMMALEILAALEKKYHIIIPEDKLKELTTVNKIIDIVEKSINKKK